MYWFVYREFTPWRWLFYDWNTANLKFCYDQKEARAWWDTVKEDIKEDKIKRPPNKLIKIAFPVATEWVPDKWFDEWVATTRMSLRLQAVLVQFLQLYFYNWSHFVKKETEKQIKKADFGVLMNMKDILMGMFRITPVKIRSSFDKIANKQTYSDWEFSQDVENVVYEVASKKYKTNMYGIYTPQLKRAMLGEKYDGSPMQKWQNDAWFKMWRINFIIWSRELGKSFLMTAFSGNFLMKELASDLEVERPFMIHYFGLSKEANTTVAMYIKKMMMNLIEDEKVIKWYKSEQKLVFFDGKKERMIMFKSQHDEDVGKGHRPHLVIIDEASRMDEEIYKTAINTMNAQIICISTINYDSKKNWFWEKYQQALIRQRDYRPIDEVIHELWVRYWLDKVRSRESLLALMKEDIFGKIKDEYFLERPMIWLKYTIDDDQNKSEAQKQMLIENALQIGEDYCLAEFFWEIQDNQVIFNYEWLVEAIIPERFDYGVVSFDEAESFDNAALVCIGVLNKMAYVIKSEILSKDMTDRYWQINKTVTVMKWRCNWDVIFAADITRWDAYYREMTEKIGFIDCPVYYTKGTDANYKVPYWYVGKKYLVDLARNDFFYKANIRIANELSNEWGLIDEMAEFKQNEKWRFEARKGKDDQVNAMMVGLFAAYINFLKEDFINQDKKAWFNREDYISLKIEEDKLKVEQDYEDMVNAYIIAEFW